MHTSTLRVLVPTTARTRWMFGFQRRLVRRWEWLMLYPNDGCLPHTSHVDAMVTSASGRTRHRAGRLGWASRLGGSLPRYSVRFAIRVPSRCSDWRSQPYYPGCRALDAADLRAVVAGFRDGLRTHQAVINRLNVYPVPDGDTGTNMALTVESVVAELDGAGDDADLATTCKAISHGSLMGARGNSGVILSQILRGFASTVERGRPARRPRARQRPSPPRPRPPTAR